MILYDKRRGILTGRDDQGVEILGQTVPVGGRERRVIVPSSVLAAISQLPASEQERVWQTLHALQQQGLSLHVPDVEVVRVKGLDEVFVLRTPRLNDIRIYVRLVDAVTIGVEDIVRERTIRSLFHVA